MTSIEISITQEKQTEALGEAIAGVLAIGDIVGFLGPLGAGKTSLARAIIAASGGPHNAPSPTYTLVEVYETEKGTLYHFDLYRLQTPDDIWELGIEDAFDDGICLIEWPELGGAAVPSTRLTIEITVEADRRTATLDGNTEWTEKIHQIASRFAEIMAPWNR